jgi:23S rRNA A2030 N6-methylase RlmJ
MHFLVEASFTSASGRGSSAELLFESDDHESAVKDAIRWFANAVARRKEEGVDDATNRIALPVTLKVYTKQIPRVNESGTLTHYGLGAPILRWKCGDSEASTLAELMFRYGVHLS